MVNLKTPADQPARAVGERGSVRSHRQWGTRFGRRRDEMRQRTEPGTLLELEELATRSVKLMEKYNPPSKKNFDKAMDLLRAQYNLNFMIICDKCLRPHDNDEMIAPER